MHGMFGLLMMPLIGCRLRARIHRTTPGVTWMPRKLPRHVECWRDRHGRLRVYFRNGKGPRTPLPADIGSEAFNSEYLVALAGESEAKGRPRPAHAAPASIAALINSYVRSAAYVGLRQTTKAGYVSRIEALRKDHGHRAVAGLTRERIINGILQPYAGRPGAAIWNEAKGNYAAAMRSQDVLRATKVAADRAGSTYSGLNIDNTTRQEIRKILDNPKRVRGFSDAEKAQMEKVVRGTWTGDLPRWIGNMLGGGGGFPSILAYGAGEMASGNVMGGLALPLVGYVFKRLGNVITSNRVAELSKMIRSRSPLAAQMRGPLTNWGKAGVSFEGSPTPRNIARTS